jgi:hypothetical protein
MSGRRLAGYIQPYIMCRKEKAKEKEKKPFSLS